MTLIVNLFAAPGSGKSTTASGLFYKLKSEGVNAELTGEYAKDLVWSGRINTLDDQFYVFGKQHHRIFRLMGNVDVIITDSPLLMSLIYSTSYPRCFADTVEWAFNQYDNLSFLLERTKAYNPKGRTQTEEQSNEKQHEIKNMLTSLRIPHTIHQGNPDGLEEIYKIVKERLK